MKPRRLWLVLAAAAILVAAALLAWTATGPLAVTRARREVEEASGPRGLLVQRYPARTITAKAQELERLAEPIHEQLGQGLAPTSRSFIVDHPPGEAAFKRLDAWLEAELARPTDEIHEPPPEARALLATLDPALTAITRELAQPGDAAWELNPATLQPAPNGSGVSHVVRLFLARALVAQHDADPASAHAALDAARDVTAPLRGTPNVEAVPDEIVCQCATLAAARKLTGVEPAWTDTIDVEQRRQAAVDALTWDAHAMLDFASPSAIRANSMNTRSLGKRLSVTAYQRSMVHAVEDDVRGIRSLTGSDWRQRRFRGATFVAPSLLSPEFGSDAQDLSALVRVLAEQGDVTRMVLAVKTVRAGDAAPSDERGTVRHRRDGGIDVVEVRAPDGGYATAWRSRP